MPVYASVFVLIALAVLLGWLWLHNAKKRREFERTFEPAKIPGAVPSDHATGVSPEPARSSRPQLSKAISSWRKLFESKTRDRSMWEEVLITSDLGPHLTSQLLSKLEGSDLEPESFLKSELSQIIAAAERSDEPWKSKHPWVIFVVGVNGVGKTTTVVKLARYFKSQGQSVAVVGADTFRKAAIDQLERGCVRVGADFFSISAGEDKEGADPGAVIFDGLSKFKDKDVILVDTSGRLTNKKNLMDELAKLRRVAQKVISEAPHDVWMVVDSTLGQNSVVQGRLFHECLGLTGLVVTKLDGLSRGGTIFQIFQELRQPIRFLGYGEAPEDLETFKSFTFIQELFDQSPPST
jgi:fused signal recognition particle receptor